MSITEATRPSGQLRQDLDVRAHARQIVAHQRDPARRGRPVFSIFAGATLTVLSFCAAIYVAHQTWYAERLDQNDAFLLLSGIFLAHAAGVLLFAYAYEDYDIGKALKLAIIMLLIAVAAIAVIAVVFAVLAALRDEADIGDIVGPAGRIIGELAESGFEIDLDLNSGNQAATQTAIAAPGLSPTQEQLARQQADAGTTALDSGIQRW